MAKTCRTEGPCSQMDCDCGFYDKLPTEKIAVARLSGTTSVEVPEYAGKVVSIICFRDALFVACERAVFQYIDGTFHRIKFVHEEKPS